MHPPDLALRLQHACAFKTSPSEGRGKSPKFLAASSAKPTPPGALATSSCAPQPLPRAGQAPQPLLPGAARLWLRRRRGGSLPLVRLPVKPTATLLSHLFLSPLPDARSGALSRERQAVLDTALIYKKKRKSVSF